MDLRSHTDTRSRSRGQSFLQGAAILTAAMAVVKVIGMLYKIPLTNLLGAAGYAHFQTAYSIFSPVYALSIAGFPVAVSKLVSESWAKGRLRSVRKIGRVSMGLLLLLGAVSFAGLFLLAGPITAAVGNPEARPAVLAMAPSIFFCCIMAAYRGYYQGLHDMVPTALSQVLEAVVKLVVGITLAWMVLQRGMEQFERTGTVFGSVAAGRHQAELLALPWAAAGAVLGVTVSTAVGALYLLVHRSLRGDGVAVKRTGPAEPVPSTGEITRALTAIALPVCMASVISHITGLVDVATVMHRIGTAMERDGGVILGMYGEALPPGLTEREVPAFLYGAYGYAVNIFNLVPSLTTALGISALPVIASKWAGAGRKAAGEQVCSIVKLTALVAIPAGLGIAALAQPILELLYPARTLEVAVAAPLLRTLGVASVFVGISLPVNSVFQAVGRAMVPVRLMAVGAVIKILANYCLVSIPALNVRAVPYGTLLCYAYILAAGLRELQRHVPMEQSLPRLLIKPALCGIICAAAANTSFGLLSRVYDSRLVCLASIVIGGSIYVVFVLFLRIITKNEAILLPQGKKVVKILEKLSFLG